jgi:hypothetical protein
MTIKDIDVTFDFTTDSFNYWTNFWENNNGLGVGNSDPDSVSKTLQVYHQILYSKKLPNGKKLELISGSNSYNYLTWENFRFGSDSIIASFRYKRYTAMIEKIKNYLPNYNEFMENFLHKTYTIGGEIIFPKRMWGLNQTRGCNTLICDRFDLTLECIRRFYNNEESPLSKTIENDKNFFVLFNDFKGYVDFFLLQDCVSTDYGNVLLWLKNDDFMISPLPQNVNDYLSFIARELNFVEKRNTRINKYIAEQ